MKKKIYEALAINILKIILWAAALSIVHGKVLRAIEIYDVKEITESSYNAYKNNMLLMFCIAVVLAAVWWGISLIPLPSREFMENYAGICALISVLLFFGTAVLSIWRIPGVYRTGGTLISLQYAFLYPCIYTAVLYLMPPNNICRILTPVKWGFRFLVGFAAIAVIVYKYLNVFI